MTIECKSSTGYCNAQNKNPAKIKHLADMDSSYMKIIEIQTSDIQLILEVLTNVAYPQTVQDWDKYYFYS